MLDNLNVSLKDTQKDEYLNSQRIKNFEIKKWNFHLYKN